MSCTLMGNADIERFYLPNGMHIEIDYGIIFWKDNKYHPFYSRYSGSCRRSKLLNNDDTIITEVIFDNPNII